MFYLSCVLFVLQIYHTFYLKAPFRLSTQPKGQLVRPAVYPFIEDVVAVEGGGNTTYRIELNRRYEASTMFKSMLTKISWFWIVSCFIVSGGCTVAVGTTPFYVGFGIGWGLPFFWAGIASWITITWVKRDLRKEKASWKHTATP